MLFLAFILAALQVGDVLTTTRVIGNGGKELNPVMNWFFGKFGMHNVLVGKAFLVTCAGVFLALYDSVETSWALGICVALYVGIVSWNSYQIYKS